MYIKKTYMCTYNKYIYVYIYEGLLIEKCLEKYICILKFNIFLLLPMAFIYIYIYIYMIILKCIFYLLHTYSKIS